MKAAHLLVPHLIITKRLYDEDNTIAVVPIKTAEKAWLRQIGPDNYLNYNF